mmetsp:Transcript_39850/g.71369  ORF Transcript_39850/g.71369 Transcript_39850/m.71369 type:complete len:230 (-) Transcript_39850:405-1094(-)
MSHGKGECQVQQLLHVDGLAARVQGCEDLLRTVAEDLFFIEFQQPQEKARDDGVPFGEENVEDPRSRLTRHAPNKQRRDEGRGIDIRCEGRIRRRQVLRDGRQILLHQAVHLIHHHQKASDAGPVEQAQVVKVVLHERNEHPEGGLLVDVAQEEAHHERHALHVARARVEAGVGVQDVEQALLPGPVPLLEQRVARERSVQVPPDLLLVARWEVLQLGVEPREAQLAPL